jgi:hypothetical protein
LTWRSSSTWCSSRVSSERSTATSFREVSASGELVFWRVRQRRRRQESEQKRWSDLVISKCVEHCSQMLVRAPERASVGGAALSMIAQRLGWIWC